MGRWNGEWFTGEPWDEDRVGMNVLRRYQSWEHGGPMVLTSDWWVVEHWGRAFELIATSPEIHPPDVGAAAQTGHRTHGRRPRGARG